MPSGEVIKGSSVRFKRIRKLLKLSQSQFANSLGVVANTVAKWERGDSTPPKLAELAGEYLLLRSKQKQQQQQQPSKPKKKSVTNKRGVRNARKR